ncbi:nucleoside/nucleotide kinase family protein [Propionibacterium australiense]|uniref:Nucleoside/nucleotide kinase family protein n=1 Tax=Propionibacterium australiense TaxID=119981 RepID=A0A383S6K2_9ACTN|nr:nucleoside/nucleotide kinase family protein [Propionibacterium australiense]RLP09717.1 nucleoside/nucleotide kinase family protein [Propionibacterium australiense]RLP10226.1 nucleoside/nucleotide kinase family protein [Propionibacterium australiense]SYZ33182.1 P-loop containing nucleoside triphosphate hydrolase [Propionibacterium australiense]VEH89377.1 nucleoside triphosphate hydrolase domain-containing protein [Propionibacterium australiense]
MTRRRQLTIPRHDVDALVARARSLVAPGSRRMLAIVGAPGAGKSTLATQLVDELGEDTAALLGMDAFHFAQLELERTGLTDVKGAPETFDVLGLKAILKRLMARDDEVVHIPVFRRDLEEPIGSAIPVAREVPLIIVEGNYLLSREGYWASLSDFFADTWFLAPDEQDRMTRLIERHRRYGRSVEEARDRAWGSDQRNAERICGTRQFAAVLVTGS